MNSTDQFGGALSQHYDAISRVFPQGNVLRYVIQDIVHTYTSTLSGARILALDIGSGGGETTKFLLAADHRITVTAVDCNPSMIDRSVQHLSAYHPRVTHTCADVEAYLAFCGANRVDIICSGWLLHNFPDPQRALLLKALFRVLKPGGLFVNLDKYLPEDQAAESRYRLLQDNRIRSLDLEGDTNLTTAVLQHELRDSRPPYRMEEQAAIRTMNNIGYSAGIRVRSELHGVMVAYKPQTNSRKLMMARATREQPDAHHTVGLGSRLTRE